MKILVTGATGFIGQNLVKKLAANDINIVVLLRESSINPFPENPFIKLVVESDIDKLSMLFSDHDIDGVVHLASCFIASHKSTDINNLISSNILFGAKLLEASKNSNVKWFLNTGTFWQHFLNEPYNPVNLYAATKQAFEDIARYYTESSKVVFSTIKLNDTYGPGDTRKKILNILEESSKTEKVLDMSPGNQLINIVYIDDVVEAFFIMINHLQGSDRVKHQMKSYAVSSNEIVSLRELVSEFSLISGKKVNINWGGRDYREREIMTPWDQYKLVPGWSPKVSLKQGIQRLGV